MTLFDVVVAGAGPAGGMVAKSLASQGFSVAIVDRKKEVGVPMHCGEGLSRRAVETNGLRVNDEWVRQRVRGSRAFMPNGKFVKVEGEGFSIDRIIFDREIVGAAQDAGSELKLHTNIRSLERTNEGWLLHTSKEDIGGRYLVAADGASSRIADMAGLRGNTDLIRGIQYKLPADHVEKNVKYIFREDDDRFSKEWLDFHYNTEKYPAGYVWFFPRGDEYNIGICGEPKLHSKLKVFCRSIGLDPDKRTALNAGTIPRSGPLPSMVGDRVVVVGDAAGLTNPVTKGGVHAALFSGRLAAEHMTRALSEENPGLLEEYDLEMKNSPFCSPRLMEDGKLIYSISLREAEFVGDLLHERNYTDISWGAAVIGLLKHPAMVTKVRLLCKIQKALALSDKYGW